jgi:hypothetical protein
MLMLNKLNWQQATNTFIGKSVQKPDANTFNPMLKVTNAEIKV